MHNQKATFKSLTPALDLSQGTEMLSEFTSEALNLLIDAENYFHTLEKFPVDQGAAANLFKIFHTIKGLSGFLNLEDIQLLSWETEKMLDLVRKEKIEFQGDVVLLTSRAINSLRKLLLLLDEQIANRGRLNSSYPDVGPLIEELKNISGGPSPAVKHVPRRNIRPGAVVGHGLEQRLISERDEAFRLKDQAERISKMKSEYLASMSHEIRTLMNSILGFSNVLQNSALSEKQREQLNNIVMSGKLLLEIVNDILDFSKSEMGKLKFEAIDFELKSLLENVIKIVQPRLQNKPVQLSFQVQEQVDSNLIGDPTRLQQVLMNLVDNAIKFTEKGAVTIFVDREDKKEGQDLSWAGPSQTLRFIVQDTGIGIPKNKQSILFESFTQMEKSTARLYGGSGLGLSICRSYVEGMGGEIWIESQPGQGSQFIFVLTFGIRRDGEAAAANQKNSEKGSEKISRDEIEQISCAGAKVLVVDDSTPNLELMQAYFETLGCLGDYVASGQEAIERLKKNQYDICFMDLQMPDLDGMETTKIIRKEGNRDLPIIALTAADADEEKEACLKVGMHGYLLKPFEVLDLKEKIIQYVRRK